MTSSEISSERLIVDGLEYALDFDSYTTLMAHGLLMKDGDACRLSTPEEMRRDPGSAGVNHPEPLAVLAIVKQALRTQRRAQPVQEMHELKDRTNYPGFPDSSEGTWSDGGKE